MFGAAPSTPFSSAGATTFSLNQRVCVQHAFRHAAAAATVTAAATAIATAVATNSAAATTDAAAAATEAATNERRSSIYPLRDRLSEQRLVEWHRRRFRCAMLDGCAIRHKALRLGTFALANRRLAGWQHADSRDTHHRQ